MTDLLDKVVIVTGASSGIGETIAKEFAAQGSKVVLVARREHELKEVADACADIGLMREKILVIVADVTKEEDVKRIIKTTAEAFTTIDVLVNNAGGPPFGSFESCTVEEFDQSIALNLRAVFMMCKEALPYLMQSKGSVVNISSTSSNRPKPLVTAYCAAKAGLDHLSRNMAKELAPKGIRVNIVSPGYIKTDVLIKGGMCSSGEERDKVFENVAKNIPVRRIGKTEEIAKVVVFISSEAASYITGALVDVNGGLHL